MSVVGKAFLAIFIVCMSISAAFSQQAICFPIAAKNGEFLPIDLTNQTSFPSNIQGGTSINGFIPILLQFDALPTPSDLPAIEQLGVELLNFIPKNTYLSLVPETLNPQLLKPLGVIGFSYLESHQKIHHSFTDWDTDTQKTGGLIEVNAYHISSLTFTEARDLLVALGYQCSPTKYWQNQVRVSMATTEIQAMAALPYITWVEPVLENYVLLNFDNPGRHGADYVRTFKGLSGEGVTVGLGDLGVFDHLDGHNRAINSYNTVGVHGNNVAGIIGGAGIIDVRYAGHAPKSTIISEYLNNVISKTPMLHDSLGMVLTNNSYGLINCSFNGEYSVNSINKDLQLLAYPEVLHIYATGNSGSPAENCGFLPYGFGTVLGGDQSAKNVLSVGNLEKTDLIAHTSSKGPTLDGRIKPEICSRANGAISTGLNNVYNRFSGTSAAAPAVTGCMTLMIEKYRSLHNGANPKGALMKAIACNTSDDLGNPGPDYSYGFGRINARKAIESIENEEYFEGSTFQGQTKSHQILVPPGKGQLKVMLYWHDEPGTAFASKALVNDLDLEVVLPNNSNVLPKILDATNPDRYAEEGVDRTNNIEQVVIEKPELGMYTILVKGEAIPVGNQEYSIVYSFVEDEILITHPMSDMTMVPGEDFPVYWEAYGNTTPFKLSYTLDNGVSWTTVDQNIAPSERSYQWKVPETMTATGRLKVERLGVETINDGTFSILGQTRLKAYKYCGGSSIRLEWDPVQNAEAYEVWRLLDEETEMEYVSTVSDLGFIDYLAGNQLFTDVWYAVIPTNSSGAVGRRSIAVLPIDDVYEEPADFFYAANLLSVDFSGFSNAPSDQIETYSWEFGDGTFSTSQFPTHQYSATGFYNVKLTLNSICGSNVVTKQLYVSDDTACRAQDSLQLVRFYNSLNGASWTSSWNLYAPMTTWYGVTLTPDGCRVKEIRLNSTGLTGKLADLHLPELTHLLVSTNDIVGEIPNFNLPKLTELILSKNELKGTLPDFNGLPALRKLSLDNNLLIGEIPDFNLPDLQYLYVNNNELSGNLPTFDNLPALLHFYGYTNKLNGAIPNYNLPDLTNLRLQGNVLSSSIPNFSGIPKLKTLYLQENELSGPLPLLNGCPGIIYFYAYENKLTGTIPNYHHLFLKRLHFHFNQLSGEIPDLELPALTDLLVNRNNLTGSIPAFANLPQLKILRVHYNNLTGTPPKFVSPNLTEIRIHNNQLSGPLPTVTHLTNLNFFKVSSNNLIYNGMEENLPLGNKFIYAPQEMIPVYQNGDQLSVEAGGDLAKNTYHWFHNGELVFSATGDSTFLISGTGDYYCRVYNSVLSDSTIYDQKLTLQSELVRINTPVTFNLSIWLQGAYNSNTSSMTPHLYNKLLLPGQTPTNNYNQENRTGQPYNAEPWSYSGSEGGLWDNAAYQDFIAENGNKKIVDWVLVAFRTGVDHMSMVAQAAAVVLEDGSIKFMHPYFIPDWAEGPFYIVVEHRNHMGVMSSQPADIVNGMLTYDFKGQNTYTANNQGHGSIQIEPGIYGMAAGDSGQDGANFSYDINGFDRIKWLLVNGGFNTYTEVDYNLDGDVTGLDNIVWHGNNGIYSMVPRPRP